MMRSFYYGRAVIGVICVFILGMVFLPCSYGVEATVNGKTAELKPGRVMIDFEKTELKDVLKALSRQTGMNFISSEIIEGKRITVYMNDVMTEDALSAILAANDLSYEKCEGNTYLVKPTGAGNIKTLTKVYRLNYLQVYKMNENNFGGGPGSNITVIGQPQIAAAGSISSSGSGDKDRGTTNTPGGSSGPKSIVEVVRTLMSKYGTIVADRRNNSLVITDIPQVFDPIEKVISELDVEPAQIMLQAEIVETTTSALQRIGIEYGGGIGVNDYFAKVTYGVGSSGAGQNPVWPTALPFSQTFIKKAYETNLAASDLFRYGTLTAADFDFVFKLIGQDENTKYLARPRIMTLNNEAAIIKVSANTAIGIESVSVAQTGQAIATAERAETGVILKITPQVNAKGDVFMYIEPSISRAVQSTLSTSFMDPTYRSSASNVLVADGDTIVIAGLIKTDNFKTTRRVPFLADIPLIGESFKSNYTQTDDTEILIFVTAHVVKKKDSQYVESVAKSERAYVIDMTLRKFAAERAQAEKKQQEKKANVRKVEPVVAPPPPPKRVGTELSIKRTKTNP